MRTRVCNSFFGFQLWRNSCALRPFRKTENVSMIDLAERVVPASLHVDTIWIHSVESICE